MQRIYGEGNEAIINEIKGFWEMGNKLDQYYEKGLKFDSDEMLDLKNCLDKLKILLSRIKLFNHFFHSTLILQADKKHRIVLYGKIEYYYDNVLSEVLSWSSGLDIKGSYAEGTEERNIKLVMRGYAKNIQNKMQGIKKELTLV